MGEKVHLGKAPVSLDPALKPGETTEDRNERLRTGKFEDRTPVGEKISNAVGSVALPIMNEIGRMAPRSKDRMKAGGKVSSASARADGCATKGKTKGKMIAMCGGGKM